MNLIGTRSTKFDAYEIALVHEYLDGRGELVVERVDWSTSRELAEKWYWTVYGHFIGGGVEAIADRRTQQQALDLVTLLLGTVVEMEAGKVWDSWRIP